MNMFSAGARQHTKASRPPGTNPLRILAKARGGSAKNITPKREKTASNVAGAKTWVWTSASIKDTLATPASAARRRARSSNGREISHPITVPLLPIACPNAKLV